MKMKTIVQIIKISDSIQSISGGGVDKFSTFPKGINHNVNVIAKLEVELASFDVVIQFISHSSMRIWNVRVKNCNSHLMKE